MKHESGGVMREPRNTQNTRKNGEVESGGVWSGGVDFNAEAQRRRDEWFGDVPSDWDIGKMRSVVSERREKFNRDEELIILSLLKDVGIIPYSEKGDVGNKSKEDHSQYKVARKSDLVINSMNVIIGSVGISPYDGYISPAYYSFVPRENVCMGFIGYLCSTRRFQKAVRCYAKGIMEIRLRVSSYDFLSMPIPLPSLSEQKAIVKYLDAETGRIDKAIAAEEKMIALLQERREIVINEAVSGSGKCGSDFNAEAQRRRGWEVRKVKQCAIIEHGSNPKIDGDVPVYGSGAESFKTCGEFKEGPSVLLGRKGTVNIPRYVEGRFWNVDTAFNVCTRKNMLLRFFYYCATCFDYDRYVSQTAIPSMTQRDYENMPIPLPPLAEQEEIVKYLDAGTGKIDRAIEVKRRQIELLRERGGRSSSTRW